MTSAQFKLDAFEGPLDLLLHLITKHKLNIYDIEISALLEQYLEYINNLEHEDYEDAADFLEMAARLIYIKTCSLLPQDEEAAELKKELEGKLIEYSLCKIAAENLRKLYIGGDIFVRKPVKVPVNKTYTREHDPRVLYDAYMGLSEKARGSKPLKADMFEPIVSHKIVSVTSKIIYVLKKLYKSGEFDMDRLYDGMTDKSEKVATFLAVLELTKSGRIFLNDDNTKIFFNRGSRDKKISSGHDEETSVSQDNFLPQKQDAEDKAVPLDKIGQITEEETVFVKLADHKPKSSYVRSVPEKIISEECFKGAEIFAEDVCESVVETVVDSPEQEAEIAEFCEETTVDEAFEAELEELKILAGLSKEPPKTVFKPNYWHSLKYLWGNSPVGDDGCGNYWKYGYNRIKG